MANITIQNLRDAILAANYYQMESGSVCYYEEQGHSSHQNLYSYRINTDGSESRHSHLEGGSSRECINKLYAQHDHGSIYPQTKSGITRAQALTAFRIAGGDISADFFQLRSDVVDVLTVWAKLTRYRKPKNANGSTGRYFFAHLQKLNAKRIGS